MEFTHYINCLPYELESASRIVHESIVRFFEESKFGISHDEFVILDTLIVYPGILQIDLARLILKGRAHTGRFLVSLETKGLVKRTPILKGRRAVISNTITEDGFKLHKKIADAIKNHMNSFDRKLTDNMEKQLIQMLHIFKKDVLSNCSIKFE